jgi:hypothetical protein
MKGKPILWGSMMLHTKTYEEILKRETEGLIQAGYSKEEAEMYAKRYIKELHDYEREKNRETRREDQP